MTATASTTPTISSNHGTTTSNGITTNTAMNGGGGSNSSSNSSSSKVRFDGLDVLAMVSYLQQNCIGRRIVNIYDGPNSETYIFKLDGSSSSSSSNDTATNTEKNNNTNSNSSNNSSSNNSSSNNSSSNNNKQFVLIESGIRFHTISSNFTADTKMTPTPFCMKLRKHLRGLRMEQLVQISTDRVIFIQCGVGHYKHTIIMELYAKGNLIITDATYTVIALLRSHIYTASNGNTEPTAVTATSSHPSNSPTTNINSNNNNNHNHAVLVQVGQVYPVSYATSIGTSSSLKTTTKDEVVMDDVTTTLEPTTLLNVPSATEFNQWIREYIETIVQQNSTVAMNAKKKKKSNIITLKMVLSQNNNNNNNNSSSNHHHHPYQNDVHHYGPALIEHCIRTAQLNPNQPLILTKTTNLPDTTTSSSTIHIHQYTNEEWERLRKSLREEGTRILQCLHDGTSSTGYILYRPMISISPDKCSTASPQADASTIIHDTTTMETFDFSDKILMEFQPILLAQHRNMQYIQFQNFALAVEIYFDHMAEQRNTIKAMNAERAALTKLEKVRLDQQVRIESLYEQQNLYEQQAFTIQYHAEDVDKAILVINSAITSGMSWDQIEQIVKVEQQQNQNPIALLIHQLDFENNAMILRLPRDTNHYDDEDDDIDNNASNGKRTDATTIDVRVLLHESAYANSNRLFAQYRAYKDKSMKTIEASSKAYKAAEETAKRQLLEAQKRKQQSGNHGMTMIGKRKVGWYEKFHWFITSDNYLVIGGRDAQQNELLVKRYLRNGDAYLHADVHGASSCILRAKRRRNVQDSTKTEIIPLSEQALREAGNFTICHSNAWSSRIITSAWWVEAHQVSKTAPTGEYLTVGSFMIRGKKNFLPPSPLEMGIGVLFRLGDDESILRHQNERRDFALLNDPDDVDVVQVKLPHLMVHEDQLSPGAMSMDQNESTSNVMNMDVNTPIEAVDADSAKTEGLEHQNDQEIDDDVEDLTVATKNVEIMEEDNLNEVPQNGTIDSANVDEADNVDDENPAADMDRQQHQKRGLSVRDRKLIKKYGSLEAAEKILASQQPQQNEKNSEPVDKTSSETTSLSTQKQAALKRGQKAKLKRVERKYMDQDEEDRTLAMLALQGGEKQKKKATKQNGKNKGIISENQQKVAAETVALLVKDTALVVDKLSDDVKSILAECVTVPQTVPAKDDSAEEVVHWDKFDADTLEQLLSLTPVEAQVAASTRLLNLKKSTRIDNFSASLSGIIRTIRKHGYENMELAVDPSTEVTSNKRKTKEEKDREAAKWKDALDDEGILDGDIDKDAIDDTVEISKLTGKPHIDDLLLYAIPVCGPYQSLSQYTYRVKLTPGSMKRGKSSKQCLDILSKAPNTANTGTEKYIELIKKVAENDWVQTICADVKISAPGASKATKQNKANIKKSK